MKDKDEGRVETAIPIGIGVEKGGAASSGLGSHGTGQLVVSSLDWESPACCLPYTKYS